MIRWKSKPQAQHEVSTAASASERERPDVEIFIPGASGTWMWEVFYFTYAPLLFSSISFTMTETASDWSLFDIASM